MKPATRSKLPLWARVAIGMFAVGWGEPVHLAIGRLPKRYRHVGRDVPAPFGCYAVGLVPAVLIAGPTADHTEADGT